jgi:hypothetical protein
MYHVSLTSCACLRPLNNYKLLNKASIPWSLDSSSKHALKNSAGASYVAGIIRDVVAPSGRSYGNQRQKRYMGTVDANDDITSSWKCFQASTNTQL